MQYHERWDYIHSLGWVKTNFSRCYCCFNFLFFFLKTEQKWNIMWKKSVIKSDKNPCNWQCIKPVKNKNMNTRNYFKSVMTTPIKSAFTSFTCWAYIWEGIRKTFQAHIFYSVFKLFQIIPCCCFDNCFWFWFYCFWFYYYLYYFATIAFKFFKLHAVFLILIISSYYFAVFLIFLGWRESLCPCRPS